MPQPSLHRRSRAGCSSVLDSIPEKNKSWSVLLVLTIRIRSHLSASTLYDYALTGTGNWSEFHKKILYNIPVKR